MRKIYIALLSFIAFITATSSSAQLVNTYLFTQSSGTYTAITGGTVLGVPTGNGTSGLDDQNFTIATGSFPFTFTFNGTGYTGCTVNTNGYITFGATAPSTSNYTPISSTAGYSGAIAAWGMDVNSVFNIAGQTGELRWETVGTSPTREIVIQWSKFRPAYSSSTSNAYVFDYQIRLAESSNAVKIVYGGNLGYLIGSTESTGSPQIGLRGATNAVFAGRTNNSGTNFTASAASTANNNTQSYSTIAATPGMPTSGLTYQWVAPPPCVPGSLAGGTTQSSVITACSGVAFNLSVTGASFGTGLTFQWESSPDGLAPWSPVASATTATASITQTATTFYRRKMTCSGVDAYSTVLQVVQGGLLDCYCPVVFTNDVEPITLVNFADINNATPGAVNASPQLENFTSIVGHVLKGQSYTLTVKGNTNGPFTTHITAFFDWNQNGVFTDAGESYYIGQIASSTGTDAVQAALSILVPAAALDGNTRMRIIKKFNTQADACNADGYGQAEDYTVNIVTPACINPTGITVSALTTTSASVSFTATGTAYVEYGPPGFTPGNGAAAGVGGTVISGPSAVAIGGLTPNTLYDLYVRQDCGGGIFSNNASAGNFRTLCNAIATFPYTETFEAASTTRSCWTTEVTTGTTNWTFGAGAGNGGSITAAHSGTVNARHFGDGTGDIALLISPQLNFTGLNPAFGAQLTFWYANQDWLGDQNQLSVYYKTSAGDSWILLPNAVYSNSVGAWTEVEMLLPGSTTGDYYIAFEGTELFGRGVAIDDVTISAAPSCPKPTNVNALAISPTTMMVNFTSPGTSFIVEYGAPGFVPGTGATAGGGTIATGATSPITINGLTAGTAYDVYVRRECTPGSDYSANVKITASSLCDAVNVPYLQDFSSAVPTAGMPSCTSMEDVNGNSGPDPNASGGRWTTAAGTSNQTYVSPVNVGKYLYDAQDPSRGADDWMYMQGLNLTGGTSYRLKFFYKGSDGPTWFEKLEVKYGTQAYHTAMTNTIYSNLDIETALANPWDSAIVDFTPATTGVYYIGFHALSDPDQAFLYIDDISVKVTPLVDAGVTTATLPACPGSSVINATIRNYNITPLNFATYPVTVTATITGTGAGSVSTTVNTGTLDPGKTMNVALPAFGFVTGIYNVTVATSSTSDPETGNDAYKTSFFVNPTPTAAIVTPAAPAICAGASVQLSSQFTTPPASPVTLPVVSSGAISVAVPDNTPAGASHTLVVSGVPAGAQLTGISVTINATHSWVSDYIINLKAPNGKVLNLFNQKGGLFEADITNMTVNSTATAPIPTVGAPFTGTYAPDAASGVGPTDYVSTAAKFSDLFIVGNGNWTLALNDNAEFDTGELTSWSITVTYAFPVPSLVWTPATGLFTNAAGTLAYTGGNVSSIYAKPDATATYTATTTDLLTGCTNTKAVTVTVNSNPVINITPLPAKICLTDELISLSATPAGGTWTGLGVSGSNFVPGATSTGNFNLTYTSTNGLGCTSTKSVVATVQDCPERMILLRDNALIVYPNPSSGQFNFRVNSSLYNKLTMKVFNNAGTLIHTQDFSGLAFGRVVPVNLTYLPAGSYMVQFSYNGGVRSEVKGFKVLIGH